MNVATQGGQELQFAFYDAWDRLRPMAGPIQRISLG